jgi:predicted nucleic acid-binding protein
MESRSLFLSAFKKISFIKLSNSIVESSCRPWGVPVKSLDSIHLASALQWKQSEEKNLVFLTQDRRLGNVAKSNGLDVSGI